MKSLDDSKKGLAVCATLDGDCENCPYDDRTQLVCVDRLRKDSLSHIQRLESAAEFYRSKAEMLESRLAQVERERDALLDDLRHSFDPCTVCKKQDICEQYCPDNDYNCPDCKDKHRCICHNCTADNDLWEWRGVPENAEEETK